MDYEHYEPPSEDIDWEVYTRNEYGALEYREPEEGWEAYGKALAEEHAQRMEEDEEDELQRFHEEFLAEQRAFEQAYEPPSVDEMIALEAAHVEERAAPYLAEAKAFGPRFEEAVRSLAWMEQRGIGNARRLLDNFAQAMKNKQRAFAAGFLFQIQQTEKLEHDGYKLLQVEPSLYESIGENRFGDTLAIDPQTGRQVIVEIKNWTGYLKGAPKKSSVEKKNQREKERIDLRNSLSTQLERYLKTGKDVLFIWKGQLAIDVMIALNALRDESKGRFRYKTAQ